MKAIYKPSIIFSVDQKQDHNLNKIARETIISRMKALNIPYKRVLGAYKYNGDSKHTAEDSFVIAERDFPKIKNEVFGTHNQESVLLLDNEYRAALLDAFNKSTPMGIFLAVSARIAEQSIGYTYDPLTETYYIIR